MSVDDWLSPVIQKNPARCRLSVRLHGDMFHLRIKMMGVGLKANTNTLYIKRHFYLLLNRNINLLAVQISYTMSRHLFDGLYSR